MGPRTPAGDRRGAESGAPVALVDGCRCVLCLGVGNVRGRRDGRGAGLSAAQLDQDRRDRRLGRVRRRRFVVSAARRAFPPGSAGGVGRARGTRRKQAGAAPSADPAVGAQQRRAAVGAGHHLDRAARTGTAPPAGRARGEFGCCGGVGSGGHLCGGPVADRTGDQPESRPAESARR